MRLVLCAVAAIGLAGCAGVYDEAAVPVAGAARALATDQCDAGLTAKTIVGAKAYAECQLAADSAFVTAIKLKQPGLFEAYAGRVRLAASQVEEGRMTGMAFLDLQAAARRDLAEQISAAAQVDNDRRRRAAAALSAMGQSMQNQAAINAINRPRTCTTTGFGNTATTTCY